MLRLVSIALWFRNLDVNKNNNKKLQAFEMWMLRRMLKITWTEHKTNNKVLQLAKATLTILSSIKKRKCKYFGHLTRESSIQRVILEGKIEGKRGKGRPRVQWMDNIK